MTGSSTICECFLTHYIFSALILLLRASLTASSYDDDHTQPSAPAAPAPQAAPEPVKTEPESAPAQETSQNGQESATPSWPAHQAGGEDSHMDQSGGYNNGGDQSYGNAPMQEDNYPPINVKEDG